MVIGATGQLGADLCQALQHLEVVPLNHTDIEITDMDSVKAMCSKHSPAAIVNTAAYVRVDDSETNPDKAFQVNAVGARNVAVAAQETSVRLAHISTDYVFGGETEPRATPYTESDTPVPLNVYGESKLAGENSVRQLCSRHFIVRTSGLFGVAGSSGKGGNFVELMLRLAEEGRDIRVVDDQRLTPTYTVDLALQIAEVIESEDFGLYHATNQGDCTWNCMYPSCLNHRKAGFTGKESKRFGEYWNHHQNKSQEM